MKQYIFVVLLVFLVACAPAQPTMEKKDSVMEAPDHESVEKDMKEEWSPEEIAAMEKDHGETMPETRMKEPGLIGGGASRYYNWDKTKFDQAVAEGKTIYLEFSADWCPACQAQEPELIAGFAELNDPNVIGFKIHYKDDQSTDEHNALIKQYQIAYQHTKVVLKDGKQVLKSPESWSRNKFVEEMRKLG
jgi:thiol-disulfide isomerase/thioredoxin